MGSHRLGGDVRNVILKREFKNEKIKTDSKKGRKIINNRNRLFTEEETQWLQKI